MKVALPFSAFADAVEEYEADSGTDDGGDMEYIFFLFCGFKITNIVSAEYLVNNIYIFSFFFSGFKITNIVST